METGLTAWFLTIGSDPNSCIEHLTTVTFLILFFIIIRCFMLSVEFSLVCERTVTSKRTQLEFELPPIELAFEKSVHEISIAEIVSLHTSINS